MAKNTSILKPTGKERYIDTEDGTGDTLAMHVAADSSGAAYDRTHPIPVEIIPEGSAFQGSFVTALGSSQMAVDGRFGVVGAIDVHNGTDDAYWTGDVGTAGGTVVFNDATRGYGGSLLSVRVNNMGVGTFFDFDAGGPVDISSYVALEFRVWIEGAWTGGDLVEVYAIDGTGEIGNRVDLGATIERTRTGEWQSAVVPLSSFGVTSITGWRIEQKAGSGARPTYSLDDVKIHLTGGPIIFSTSAPPGTLIRVEQLVIQISAPYDGRVGISPLGFLTVPTVPIGALGGLLINGVFTITSLWRNLRDMTETAYFMEPPLVAPDGSTTTITLVKDLRSNPIVITGPEALNRLELHVMDDFTLAERITTWQIGRIELAPT